MKACLGQSSYSIHEPTCLQSVLSNHISDSSVNYEESASNTCQTHLGQFFFSLQVGFVSDEDIFSV